MAEAAFADEDEAVSGTRYCRSRPAEGATCKNLRETKVQLVISQTCTHAGIEGKSSWVLNMVGRPCMESIVIMVCPR